MVKLFRILVKGEAKDYWLNLEAPEDATLNDLDLVLRKVWLECCGGHESSFTIKRISYTSSPEARFIHESPAVRLGDVLRPGLEFGYIYGSVRGGWESTRLQMKVISDRVALEKKEQVGIVRILARNDNPGRTCSCGEPAFVVCTRCIDSGEEWLCEDCARFHTCGRENQLPFVNSPRMGVCKYMGNAEEEMKYLNYLKELERQEKIRFNDMLIFQGKEPVFKDVLPDGPDSEQEPEEMVQNDIQRDKGEGNVNRQK